MTQVNFRKLLILGVMLLMPIAISNVGAIDMETLTKASAKQNETSEPFTEQELIEKIRRGEFGRGGSICSSKKISTEVNGPNDFSNEELERCSKRLKLFDDITFGRCGTFNLQVGPFRYALQYLASDERSKWVNKEIFNGNYNAAKSIVGSGDCTQARFDKMKSLLDKVTDAALIALEKAKKDNNVQKACQSSQLYQLYDLSETIISTSIVIKANEEILKREKERGAVSGYVNKEIMYNAGKEIADSKRFVEQLFQKYKEIGGKASRVEDVRKLKDPCA